MQATLRVLDAVEGFHQGGPDLYQRVVIDCLRDDGLPCQAYSYRYYQPIENAAQRRIQPDASGTCGWR